MAPHWSGREGSNLKPARGGPSVRWSAPSEHIPQKPRKWRRAAVSIRIRVTPDELLSRQPRHACPVDPPNWRLVYPRRSTHPWLRLQAGSRGISGGDPRIRTANVYPVGPDLQSGAAHAIAARSPVFWSEWRDSNPRPLVPQTSALPDCATFR